MKKTKLLFLSLLGALVLLLPPKEALGAETDLRTATDVASESGVISKSAIEADSGEQDIKPAPEIFDEISVGGLYYTVTGIEGENVYVEVSGVVNEKATTVYIPKTVSGEAVTMTVTGIAEDCFSYMKRLRKITVVADITYIGTDAFKNSSRLRNLVIKTEALKKVGKNALSGVNGRISVKVPEKSLKSYRRLFKNKGIDTSAVVGGV